MLCLAKILENGLLKMEIVMSIMLSVFGGLLTTDNQEFFKTSIKQMKQGAKWHYVGVQPLDPTVPSLPGRICDTETGKCGKPYIMWKLKMLAK